MRRWASVIRLIGLSCISLSILEGDLAEAADIDLTPRQATVYVGQCTQFYVTISPPQPSTVDISIEYSDPSRLSYLTTGFPIYAGGVSQYFSACGRVAGTEPVTITAVLPASLGGAMASATAPVVNPVPEPWRMFPTSATAGSGAFDLEIAQAFTLTLLAESQVLWNGVPKPTSLHYYEGPCPGICPPPYLRARISAEDVSTPGSVQVTVRNPPPGGGESAPLTFTILPGLLSEAVPLSPRVVAFLALLLAASGTYVLRNGGGSH